MKRKFTPVAAIVLCILMLFTACSSAPGGNAAEETAATGDKTEITLWDLRTQEANAAMINAIIKGFEAKYPDIKVKRSAFKVDDLRNTIKPALNSGKGPDIFSYDSGAGYLGVLASNGKVLDMTPYAEQYKWNERFQDWALNKAVYDGKLYGIANELEMLGVFYNKKMFDQIGAEPPKTYDEFISLCKAFKEKGIQPLIMEDKDQWQGFHYESIWLNSFVGPDKVKQAVKGEIPWTSEGFGPALDEVANLYKEGYATPKPLSIIYEDANLSFYAGKAAMRVTGTWIIPDFVDNMGDNVGFFYLPMATPELASCPPGGLGDCIVVNSQTKNADAAMLFIDYMFGPESMKLWYEAGLLPAVKDVDYSSFNITPLFKEVIDTINSAESLGENIDVLMNTSVNNATMNYMQELIAGKKDGQTCMEEKQKAFEEKE